MNERLRRLFDVCIEHECNVQGVWAPREQLADEDAISREPDASDWGLSPLLFGQVCKRFKVQPTCDLFASDAHHHTTTFVSRIYSPGCAAIQAFSQDWGQLVGDGLAWVFPPL